MNCYLTFLRAFHPLRIVPPESTFTTTGIYAWSFPHNSVQKPRYVPTLSALNHVSRITPGIASCLTPRSESTFTTTGIYAWSFPHNSVQKPRYVPTLSALNHVSRITPGIASCLTPNAGTYHE